MRADDDPAFLDAVVIGAGFGGLGAALSLAERGARVAIVESLAYPGGCASTFRRGGYRFEAGATLFSGLAPDQLFGDWIAHHRLDVTVDWLDPLVELRSPALRLSVGRDRDAFIEALASLPGAPAAQIRAFFAYQRRIADTLWSVFDDPAMLPPLSARAFLRHVARVPRYTALLPLLGRPLSAVLARFDVKGFRSGSTSTDSARSPSSAASPRPRRPSRWRRWTTTGAAPATCAAGSGSWPRRSSARSAGSAATRPSGARAWSTR